MAIKPPYAYVGGKRRLLKLIEQNIPAQFGNFYEPFLGAGAVAVHVMENYPDRHYFLSDYNPHIPPTWIALKNNIDHVIELLNEHHTRNSPAYFESVRNWDRYGMFSQMINAETAARFIYICNTSFRGGYRMSMKGYSTDNHGKPDWTVQEKNLRNLSALLNDRHVHIFRSDFNRVASEMQAGDFLYLDPPYVVDDIEDPEYTGNDTYIKLKSTEEVVREVYELMDEANTRGAYALGSNTSTTLTEELWDGWNRVEAKIQWTGGKNLGKEPATEVLWGNNALHRLLTTDRKYLPGEEPDEHEATAPATKREKGAGTAQDPLPAPDNADDATKPSEG